MNQAVRPTRAAGGGRATTGTPRSGRTARRRTAAIGQARWSRPARSRHRPSHVQAVSSSWPHGHPQTASANPAASTATGQASQDHRRTHLYHRSAAIPHLAPTDDHLSRARSSPDYRRCQGPSRGHPYVTTTRHREALKSYKLHTLYQACANPACPNSNGSGAPSRPGRPKLRPSVCGLTWVRSFPRSRGPAPGPPASVPTRRRGQPWR